MVVLATRAALLGLLLVLLGSGVSLAGSSNGVAIHPIVSPATGNEKTVFVVRFVVDRRVDGYRWLTVELVSAGNQKDCEHQESATVTSTPKGQRVSVTLRPIDKYRWCTGTYNGKIRVEYRIGCGDPGLDQGPCYTTGPTVARFRVRVE